jgi:hypothetical protein
VIVLDRPAQSAFADSQFAVRTCALPAFNCGQARLEGDVNDPPERQPSRDRAGARAHACLTARLAGAAAPAPGSGARILGRAILLLRCWLLLRDVGGAAVLR